MPETIERQESTPASVRTTHDACWEGAFRVNVVLRMLDDHDCFDDNVGDGGSGGFDLTVAKDELKRIRDILHAAYDAPEVQR
jgi:hypothetical protein